MKSIIELPRLPNSGVIGNFLDGIGSLADRSPVDILTSDGFGSLSGKTALASCAAGSLVLYPPLAVVGWLGFGAAYLSGMSFAAHKVSRGIIGKDGLERRLREDEARADRRKPVIDKDFDLMSLKALLNKESATDFGPKYILEDIVVNIKDGATFAEICDCFNKIENGNVNYGDSCFKDEESAKLAGENIKLLSQLFTKSSASGSTMPIEDALSNRFGVKLNQDPLKMRFCRFLAFAKSIIEDERFSHLKEQFVEEIDKLSSDMKDFYRTACKSQNAQDNIKLIDDVLLPIAKYYVRSDKKGEVIETSVINRIVAGESIRVVVEEVPTAVASSEAAASSTGLEYERLGLRKRRGEESVEATRVSDDAPGKGVANTKQ